MAEFTGQATNPERSDPRIDNHADNRAPSPCRGSNGHAESGIASIEASGERELRRMQSQDSGMDDKASQGGDQAEFEAGAVSIDTKAVQAHEQQAKAGSIQPSAPKGLQFDGHASEATTNDVVVPLPEDVLLSEGAASRDNADGLDTTSTQTCWQPEPARPLVHSGENTDAKEARKRLALALARTSVMSVSEVPKGTVRASKVVAGNAMLMAAAEIVIEVLVLVEVFPKLPFRLDFFFLTILSGLLGFHVVRGLAQDHFDTSMNALQVSGLVEIALIAGDIKFMVEQGSKYSAAVPTRAAFAVLTCVNLVLVVYLAVRLLRYHRAKRRSPPHV